MICLVVTWQWQWPIIEPSDVDYGALELEDDHTTVLRGHRDMVCACVWNPTTSTLASGYYCHDTSLSYFYSLPGGLHNTKRVNRNCMRAMLYMSYQWYGMV
jgi:hypothetical protein